MMVVSREQMTTDRSFVMQTGCAQFSIYTHHHHHQHHHYHHHQQQHQQQQQLDVSVDLFADITLYRRAD